MGGRVWTYNEKRLLAYIWPHSTWQEIALRLPNRSRDSIRLMAKTLKLRKEKQDPLKRFVKFVRVDSNDCWIWTGGKCRGYGHFKCDGITHIAHRWIYKAIKGDIPDDMTLDHKCRNTSCVNVEHLRIMDGVTNVMIGEGPAAKNARKTHCNNGHILQAPNLVGQGKIRRCKICHNEYTRKYRERPS